VRPSLLLAITVVRETGASHPHLAYFNLPSNPFASLGSIHPITFPSPTFTCSLSTSIHSQFHCHLIVPPLLEIICPKLPSVNSSLAFSKETAYFPAATATADAAGTAGTAPAGFANDGDDRRGCACCCDDAAADGDEGSETRPEEGW